MHDAHMRQALRLAHQQTGRTGSNPAVGCVIVNNGTIIATGATADGGTPHAEATALAIAGDAAQGATLYTTLEPCSHTGKTPPCADAIIKAGIAHVVSAMGDPDPKVNGSGYQRLRDAGITVTTGVCHSQAQTLLEGFIRHRTQNRPLVSMKLATTLDGYIANPAGESQWITNAASRQFGHQLRASHDAILTGSGTYLADAPKLTCRLLGLEHASPRRFIADRRQRIRAADGFTILSDYQDVCELLTQLAQHGVMRLLIEAGAELSSAFLSAGLVDELYWMQAPILFGGGTAAVHGLPVMAPSAIPRATLLTRHAFGSDICHHLRLTTPLCSQAS